MARFCRRKSFETTYVFGNTLSHWIFLTYAMAMDVVNVFCNARWMGSSIAATMTMMFRRTEFSFLQSKPLLPGAVDTSLLSTQENPRPAVMGIWVMSNVLGHLRRNQRCMHLHLW